MRYVAIILCLIIASCSLAQYDLGLSAGTFRHIFKYETIHDLDRSWIVSLSYRERVAQHTDLGFDASLFNSNLTGNWSNGGMSYTNSISAQRLDLTYLQFSPYLDVRMDRNAVAVVRFGPQLGFKVTERITGRATSWSIAGGSTSTDLDAIATDHFNKIDVRIMFGLGFRFGSDGFAFTIDPFVSHGLSSLIETRYHRERSTVFGLRIGLSRRFDRKPFTRSFREGAPVDREGSE